MSVKEVSPDLLADAGLSENEIQIYLAILGLGNATLGQVSQVTGIDIFETQEVISQLENLDYVKKLPGILSRYIPMEPFLKAFVDIDKGFQIDMAELKSALTRDVENFGTNIDKTSKQLAQILDFAQDRFKSDDISSNTEEKLGSLFSDQINFFITTKDKVTDILKQSVVDLSDKLMKGIGERQGSVGHTTLGTIDAAKTELEASRQLITTLSNDLSSDLQNSTETLKTELFTILDQSQESYGTLTKDTLDAVEKIIEKYHSEFVRSSTYLKEDFTRLVDRQTETITLSHDSLISNLRNVFDEIGHDWNQIRDQVQPELDIVNTGLSELSQKLNSLGAEIQSIEVGFRKPFPQEQIATKTNTLASELTTLVENAKSILGKLNPPIEAALSGSKTMIEKSTSHISDLITHTKDELDILKQDADEKIESKVRNFKTDLVGENRASLEQYFAGILDLVTNAKDQIDGELSNLQNTQTSYIQQFLPNSDTQYVEVS